MKKIHRTTVILIVAAILLVSVCSYGVYADASRKKLSLQLENMYQRSLLEVTSGLENIELDISRLMATNDDLSAVQLLSRLAVRANGTQINLSQLPLKHIAIDNTIKFSNQLMSYSLFCAEKISGGEDLPEDYNEKLQELHQTAVTINQGLAEVSDLIATGRINVTQLNTDVDKEAENEELPNILGDAENDSIKYPTLIFDGPFSDGQEDTTPKTEREKVAPSQAQKTLEELTGRSFDYQGEVNGEIPTYAFSGGSEETPWQGQVTVEGGLLYWFTRTREVTEAILTAEEAQKKAEAFAKNLEYGDVTVVWQEQYDNMIIFNFAPQQDDILLYPDLFKVKVALDNGEIVGFEGRSYIVNHHERTLTQPALSEEQAKEKVHKSIQLEEKGRLAIAPLENKEILCWEFYGKLDQMQYVIYISAADGREEAILRIISTETGKMIM